MSAATTHAPTSTPDVGSGGYVEADASYASIEKVFVAPVETLWNDKPFTSSNEELVLVDTLRKPGQRTISRAFVAAKRPSPDDVLYFPKPTADTTTTNGVKGVNAAIVTAGGLCPGLNNVIREITLCLYNQYQANEVWGITGGWQGLSNREKYPPLLLTKEIVEHVHHQGGSFLRTSRGGLDVEKTIDFLMQKDISHLYIIGGDGTHRAAYKIHQACQERRRIENRERGIAVVGIPKTIDNDIDYIDRSFGFVTAVEAAQASIRTAHVEAKCTVPNGVGIIKLMGREAGFLAAFAALGSGGDVDAVVVPEVPTVLEGPNGILPFIRKRVQEKQYAVIVVAEGAGQELMESIQGTEAGSGNKKLPPIAELIRDKVFDYFEKKGDEARMKFVDPSYSVRSVPANAADSLYCTQLAQNAVHGAMKGYTGFSVGMVSNRVVYIPIPQLVSTSPRYMDPYGEVWERILAITGQPDTRSLLPPPTTAAAVALAAAGPSAQTGAAAIITTGSVAGGVSDAIAQEVFPKIQEPTGH